MFTACLCVGTANAADECGPGCHSVANGECVVNGWEVGAAGWNECPAGSHPRPPCSQHYAWHKHARACMPAN
jgi:hypothetical protein